MQERGYGFVRQLQANAKGRPQQGGKKNPADDDGDGDVDENNDGDCNLILCVCVCVILCLITRDGRHDVKRISSCQCGLTPSHSLGESHAALSRFRLTIKPRRIGH